MTEKKEKTVVPKKVPEKVSKLLQKAPIGFIRGGGTPTTKSAELYERRFQEAEKRRDIADIEKKVSQVPVTEGGGMLQTSQMTAHPEIPKAYIHLKYVNEQGAQIYHGSTPVEGVADLIVGDGADPSELTLMFVCPRCVAQGQKHLQDCQLRMNQRNKYFEFVAGMGEPQFVFEGEVYNSAGVIVASDTFRCPDCGWKARIDHNKVWPG